nr:unnamed protein product [Callosobruchus analis]
MADPEKDSDFFDKAEKALNVKVPESLKYLLIACGFEEQSVFGTITNENISEIEEFARYNLHQIIDEKDLDRYYGIYRNKPTLYKIPIGHRNIITMLKDYSTRRIILDNRQKRHGFPKADEGNAKEHCRSHLESNEECSVSEIKSSLELPEENFHITDEKMKTERKIYDALLQWVKKKCQLRIGINLICHLTKYPSQLANEEKCMISCFCGTKNSSYERWIYSNFQQYLLKKHINCIASGTLKPTTSVKRNQLITSYLKEKSQGKLNFPPKIILSEDIVISRSTISSNINKDSAEGIDFYNNYQIVNTQNESPLNSATAGTVSVLKEKHPENYAVLPSTSKWKQLKYQRSSRTKRSRERLDLNQTSITNFFTIVDKVYKVLNDSAGKDNTFFHTVFSSESKVNQNDLGSFLNKLLEISRRNVQGPKNKNFYDRALKRFAIYIYYVGGGLLYETLHANLPQALPSITTLNRFLTSTKNPIQEGFLKNKLNDLVWPKTDDVAVVDMSFIFYGPIHLLGEGPFQLKRHDLINIEKRYKEFK